MAKRAQEKEQNHEPDEPLLPFGRGEEIADPLRGPREERSQAAGGTR